MEELDVAAVWFLFFRVLLKSEGTSAGETSPAWTTTTRCVCFYYCRSFPVHWFPAPALPRSATAAARFLCKDTSVMTSCNHKVSKRSRAVVNLLKASLRLIDVWKQWTLALSSGWWRGCIRPTTAGQHNWNRCCGLQSDPHTVGGCANAVFVFPLWDARPLFSVTNPQREGGLLPSSVINIDRNILAPMGLDVWRWRTYIMNTVKIFTLSEIQWECRLGCNMQLPWELMASGVWDYNAFTYGSKYGSIYFLCEVPF